MMVAVIVLAGAAVVVPVITVLAGSRERVCLDDLYTLIIPLAAVFLVTAHLVNSVRVLEVTLTAVLVLMTLILVLDK